MVSKKPKKDTAAMFARLAGQADEVEEILTDSVQPIEPQQELPSETLSVELTKQEDQILMSVSTQRVEKIPSTRE